MALWRRLDQRVRSAWQGVSPLDLPRVQTRLRSRVALLNGGSRGGDRVPISDGEWHLETIRLVEWSNLTSWVHFTNEKIGS
jgi:hypothetical protein